MLDKVYIEILSDGLDELYSMVEDVPVKVNILNRYTSEGSERLTLVIFKDLSYLVSDFVDLLADIFQDLAEYTPHFTQGIGGV